MVDIQQRHRGWHLHSGIVGRVFFPPPYFSGSGECINYNVPWLDPSTWLEPVVTRALSQPCPVCYAGQETWCTEHGGNEVDADLLNDVHVERFVTTLFHVDDDLDNCEKCGRAFVGRESNRFNMPCFGRDSNPAYQGDSDSMEKTHTTETGTTASGHPSNASIHGLPDSGDRTQLHGGAMRDRPFGKGRYDLISPFFLQDLALLLEKGAAKYEVRNWEKGYSLPLCLDSAFRHLTQLMAGDTSEDHAIAVAWNLMAFIHIRHLITSGLLPEDLARGYVPLHVENPVTGDTET